jgi:molecular chaperone DnaK (HSP70)
MSTDLTIKSLLPRVASEQLSERIENIHNKTFVGIDFGTSTTVVSIASIQDGGNPFFVKAIDVNQKLADGAIHSSYKVPSVIAWYNNNLIIGEGAKKLKYKLQYGKNLWHSFKMELGEDVGSKYPASELGKDHKLTTILNPVDATKLFFRYLKAQIERHIKDYNLADNIEYAISIPASFEANQRRDLLEAIESNGMMVNKQSLIDEPNAAFLSYILNSESTQSTLKIPDHYQPNVLVFDFGAGTCDISILEVGKDNYGIYSKNIAISKFEKLGGDNIDRLIAVDVLLPQLLKGSGLTSDDFLTREMNEHIIPSLMPSAERLKIQISQAVKLQLEARSLPAVADSDEVISIGKPVDIDTTKGNLTIEEPKLTFKEFAKINHIFTNEKANLPVKRIENELEFPNVFMPIKSALKKANLDKTGIDYVLFIGGSSKNPFIQHAVSSYFNESNILVPDDLQAHVSVGAALHSLIYNGFGKNVISPITSEPIMLITKDGYRERVESIVSAGTIMPSDVIVIDNLSPQRDGQEVIELPICVGNRNKILHNIKIHNPDGGFSTSDKVKLEVEINADKVLMVRASAGSRSVMAEPINPFTNSELSTKDRIRKRAERDFNLECEKNGGEPTYQALLDLHKAYVEIGLDFKAAETLEQIEQMFPGKVSLNNMAIHYSNAGKKEKAIKFYEEALEKQPSATVARNLAEEYKFKDKEKYREYLEKAHEIDPDHNVTNYNLAQEYRSEGKTEEAEKLIMKAFENWKRKFETNQMQKWDYSWFASCAEAMGKHDYAKHIRDSEPKENRDQIFNPQNLTQITQEEGIQKNNRG